MKKQKKRLIKENKGKEVKTIEEQKEIWKRETKKYMRFSGFCGIVWFLDACLIVFLLSQIDWFLGNDWISVLGILQGLGILIGGFFIGWGNKAVGDRFRRMIRELRPTKIETRKAKETMKRIGWIKKMRFTWLSWRAEGKLKEYKELAEKLQEKVGKIKGDETNLLLKIKGETIETILGWKEDFAITRPNTNIPVDEEFLMRLSLDDLYEEYLIKGIYQLEDFINGNAKGERIIEI